MIGTVYKIEIGEKIYIGSTIQTLTERQRKHNLRLKQNVRTNKLYEECRVNNIEKIYCIPLETKEIEDDLEIRELENKYIDELKPLLNHKSSYTGLTHNEYNKQDWIKNGEHYREKRKEYYENNKEKINKKKQEHYIKNKEYYKEQHKKYYENNKEIFSEKSKEYRENNKEILSEKSKKYRENNVEKIREMKKIYYENNKDIIREKKKKYNYSEKEKEDVSCPICGFVGRKKKLYRHQQTKRCLAARV